MRRVIYSMSVSLDGYVETVDGGLDWSEPSEEVHTFINDQQAGVDAYLYGRRLYELMQRYWPTADEDPAAPPYVVEFARIWRDMPKVVFSATLDRVEGNARLVRDGVAQEVTALKAQPGRDLAVGGASLAGSLMRLGLVDEYRLFVVPTILGGGKPLFPPLERRIDVRLTRSRTFDSGVQYLHYVRADLELGDLP